MKRSDKFSNKFFSGTQLLDSIEQTQIIDKLEEQLKAQEIQFKYCIITILAIYSIFHGLLLFINHQYPFNFYCGTNAYTWYHLISACLYFILLISITNSSIKNYQVIIIISLFLIITGVFLPCWLSPILINKYEKYAPSIVNQYSIILRIHDYFRINYVQFQNSFYETRIFELLFSIIIPILLLIMVANASNNSFAYDLEKVKSSRYKYKKN